MSLSLETPSTSTKKDAQGQFNAQCIFLVEPEMRSELKRTAAELRYRSMSEMVRIVMKQYLEQVKKS